MALIALEGIDGSGKATQTALLVDALTRGGYDVETYAFPAYQTNRAGKLLRELLANPSVQFANTDPRLASLPYSLDRFESSPAIRAALGEGKVVVLDRFIDSNKIHQGWKFATDEERIAYINWLEDLEHELLGIPRPDLVIYLKAPLKITLQLLAEKRASKGGLLADGEKDEVEKDWSYLENSHWMANWLANYYDHWRFIDCVTRRVACVREKTFTRIVLREVSRIWSD